MEARHQLAVCDPNLPGLPTWLMIWGPTVWCGRRSSVSGAGRGPFVFRPIIRAQLSTGYPRVAAEPESTRWHRLHHHPIDDRAAWTFPSARLLVLVVVVRQMFSALVAACWRDKGQRLAIRDVPPGSGLPHLYGPALKVINGLRAVYFEDEAVWERFGRGTDPRRSDER